MSITFTGPTAVPDLSSAGTFRADALTMWNWAAGTGSSDLLGQIDELVVYGSSANGEYIRIADGTQICWYHDAQLTYATTTTINVTWTYPAAFNAEPAVYCDVQMGDVTNNVTPANTEVLHPRFNSRTVSQVVFTSFRINGMTNFQSGDFAECSMVAIGTWS